MTTANEAIREVRKTQEKRKKPLAIILADIQNAGYFVLLIFVRLVNVELSIARVATRVSEHGRDVPEPRLRDRFPRTQKAISHALQVAERFIVRGQ
ncbi:hypothetical protein [Novosphingobium naphthalenivorans]|uniref:hypothetical protein n=1 Tax=Novosphingobium naphthalenivorans TaxID=273168 RepID=UPI0004468DBD|nr:hypothetical protein [Novosphingobium naphthalenivorans]EZP65310.1 hypothetical protein BV96_04694 [Sphingomonas paucimobilis]